MYELPPSITAPAYFTALSFSYIETFSIGRSLAAIEKQAAFKAEYKELMQKRIRRISFTSKDEKRIWEVESLMNSLYSLYDVHGGINYAAERTHTFNGNHVRTAELLHALQIPVLDIPYYMCAPIYRDGVVFYDVDGNVVSMLSVCLSCYQLQIADGRSIDADCATYDHLKKFFIDLGHEVEHPDVSGGESIRSFMRDGSAADDTP
ncbi:hypothetical protein [Paraflavitalea pollutisoli]|uniref:hypothetical protein n=1 Tax=Paraflavitalea pollutisoli TaxID=3034143 RepID=UPI0023EC02E2|nr:hypothetical protein [Paraflavitalea sp. H1-2-19X]